MRHLVTVTCNRDKEQMLLQAESIQLFLEPCTHWVIVNEPDLVIDRHEWHSLLAPYYTKHRLNIIVPPMKYQHLSGYQTQMLYKLWIYTLIKADYLILDSKNFFVNPCYLKDWARQEGSGHWWDLTPNKEVATFNLEGVVEKYYEKLDLPVDYVQFAPVTPFVCRKEILESYMKDGKLENILLDDLTPSEFIYYSILFKNKNPNEQCEYDSKYLCKFFAAEIEWDSTFEFGDSKIASVHRSFFNQYPDAKTELNSVLAGLGFKFRFTAQDYHFDNYNPNYDSFTLLSKLNKNY